MARAVLAFAALLALAACAPRTTTATAIGPGGEPVQVVMHICDDGGDGGVLIGGVCL